MLSPKTKLTLDDTESKESDVSVDRRTNRKPFFLSKLATSSKRCGWRGTITVSKWGIFAAWIAVSMRASSPSRVLAAKSTGRF